MVHPDALPVVGRGLCSFFLAPIGLRVFLNVFCPFRDVQTQPVCLNISQEVIFLTEIHKGSCWPPSVSVFIWQHFEDDYMSQPGPTTCNGGSGGASTVFSSYTQVITAGFESGCDHPRSAQRTHLWSPHFFFYPLTASDLIAHHPIRQFWIFTPSAHVDRANRESIYFRLHYQRLETLINQFWILALVYHRKYEYPSSYQPMQSSQILLRKIVLNNIESRFCFDVKFHNEGMWLTSKRSKKYQAHVLGLIFFWFSRGKHSCDPLTNPNHGCRDSLLP